MTGLEPASQRVEFHTLCSTDWAIATSISSILSLAAPQSTHSSARTTIGANLPRHTVNSGSEMVEAKHVSGKNIYWSTFIGKSKERKIFDFLHCPFEPPAKQHRPVSQLGWILWCMLARPSKGQCRNSKIFPPLLLTVKVDQNIFFPETCFASTISEPKFTVCDILM